MSSRQCHAPPHTSTPPNPQRRSKHDRADRARDYDTYPLAGAVFRPEDLLGEEQLRTTSSPFLLRPSTVARIALQSRRGGTGASAGRVQRDTKQEQRQPLFWRGQFECPQLFEIRMPLHERLSPAKVLPQLHITALRPFLVSNRSMAFVYRDQVRLCVWGRAVVGRWWR